MSTGTDQTDAAGRPDADPTADTGMPQNITPDKMERVRQILFGKEMKSFTKDLERLESRLTRELESQKDENSRNLSSLEEYFRGEVNALLGQIQAERKNRTEALDAAEQKAREAHAEIEKQLAQLGQETANARAELKTALESRIQEEQSERNAEIDRLEGRVEDVNTTLTGSIAAVDEKAVRTNETLHAEMTEELNAERAAREADVQNAQQDLNDSVAAIEQKLDTLKARVTAEDDTLRSQILDRITIEQKTRDEAVENLAESLKQVVAEFERKLSELTERGNASERTLRDQILSLSKTLGNEIESRTTALHTDLDRNVTELRGDKVDRVDLASLLGEISMRITKEFDELDLPDED